MINEYISKTNLFKDVQKSEEIIGGHSGSKTYCITQNNKKYFLKIRNYKTPMLTENLRNFKDYSIKTPKVFEFGEINNQQYYITEFINGVTLKSKYDVLTNEDLYNFGAEIGKQQRKLSRKFKTIKSADSYNLFKSKNIDLITQNINNLINLKDKIKPENFSFLKKLYENINIEKDSLIKCYENEIEYFTHNDLKVGNFLLLGKEIFTIDYEESTYNYIAYSLRSDFYEIIERTPIRYKTWFFIKGFIDSFFNNSVPVKLQYQLKFMFYVSLTKRISKRINEGRFDMIDEIAINLKSNFKTFNGIDNMFAFHKPFSELICYN